MTGEQTRTITGFGKHVTSVCFLAETDNLVASSGDKTVQMKTATNGRNVRTFSGASDFLHAAASSANGKLIAAGGQDSRLRLWEENGQVIAVFEPPGE